MTLETKKAIVDALVGRGVPATLEWPSFIAIPTNGTGRLEFGDVADDFMGNHIDPDDNVVETFESDLPSSTNDVKAVADFIACIYTAIQEVSQ